MTDVPVALSAAIRSAIPARMSGDVMWSSHQTLAMVMTYDDSAMGIAQNYLSAHLYEFVDKEKTAFETSSDG